MSRQSKRARQKLQALLARENRMLRKKIRERRAGAQHERLLAEQQRILDTAKRAELLRRIENPPSMKTE